MGGRARTHADGFGDRRATATPHPCDVLKKRNAALTRSGWAALSRLGFASAAPPAPVLAVGQVNGSPGEGHDHMATGPEPLQFHRGLPKRHGSFSLVAICLRTTVRAERHRVQRFSGQVLFPVPDAPAGREYRRPSALRRGWLSESPGLIRRRQPCVEMVGRSAPRRQPAYPGVKIEAPRESGGA